MRQAKVLLMLLFVFLTNSLFAGVPLVQLENSKGEKINTSSLVDNKTPFIISFWSTTCKPCLRELDAVSEQMPDWLDEVDFRVIAISTDDSRSASKAKALAEGRGWDEFTVLYDKNQEFMRAMNVSLIPHVFVFNAKGEIIYTHTGYTPGSELEILKVLKENK